MSENSFYRHGGSFHPEQTWCVLNAAQHYSVIASENPAISHFYSFDVAPSADMTLAVPDGCVDIVFDCDPLNPKGNMSGVIPPIFLM